MQTPSFHPRPRRAAGIKTFLLVCGFLVWGGFSAMGGDETFAVEIPEGFPQVILREKLRGEAAVEAIGRQLPALASFYRTTPQDLAERLRRDRSLWVDQRGRLLYVCELHGEHEDTEEPEQPVIMASAPFPEEDTFKLHSRPRASRVIYLDFDGVNASGTSWGSGAIGRAFDTDGNPSSFSSSERAIIQGVWQRVAEDFAMYDVNVTTEDPGIEALRKSNSSDTTYGIRVAICGSSSDWYGKSAGGVAYVGSFNWNSDTPCWVFPGSLSNSEKNIAEAASHEIGHTLGLSHDGKDVNGVRTEYYSGQGNWAPIMGTGYSKPITQWSRGEYADANNKEDDLAKMLTYGVAYRVDDHGSTLATATSLSGVSFNVPGNIERATDIDYFKFQTGTGPVTLSVHPAPRGPNLRIQLALMNSAGTTISTANPADTSAGVQPASISLTLPAGVYYASVQGTGSGDPLTTGYSAYGSLGEYTLSGSLPASSTWIATSPSAGLLWTTAGNWSGGSYAYGVGAVARLVNNIAGNQTISLQTPQVLGTLQIGDADSLNSFTLQNGSGGSLTFDSPAGEAWLIKTAGADDYIGASLILNSPLVISNNSAADLNLVGPITGTGSLQKTGGGNLVLQGTNFSTGNILVSAGKLSLGSTALIHSPAVDIRAGAELVVQPPGLLLKSGQSITGDGLFSGDLTLQNGAFLSPGSNSTPGTLRVTGTVTLQAGARLRLDLGPDVGPGENDLLAIDGDLNLAGPVAVDFSFPPGLPTSPATFTVITYSGVLGGSVANLQPVNTGNRYIYTFDDSTPGEIQVHLTGAPLELVWKGDGTVNRWDAGTTANWTAVDVAAAFGQFDRVKFEDTGLNTPSISLAGFLEAGLVSVDSSKDYTFAGSGRLTGRSAITKAGTGVLTISTANDYEGETLVQGGRIRAGNSAAFGSPMSGVTVIPDATLDLNGYSLAAKPITLSGAGFGGAGALVNGSFTSVTNAIQSLTLAGHTTIGGISRWDLRASPWAVLNGNNFNLVKTGGNEIWFSHAGPSALGNITISHGTLGFEGSTTLGDTARTITVLANATLAVSGNADNALTKNMVLNGGRVNCISGFNTFVGLVSLAGSNTVNVNSSMVLRGNISGPGGLTKTGPGTLLLTGANSYAGETRILGGAVEVYSSLALGSSGAGTFIGTGARLDVRGQNLGAELVTVQGAGLGNAGAIVNTGSSQNNALRHVTLSGATTLGGINRWDIRGDPAGSFIGNNYALTKRGRNEIWLVNVGDTGLGAITVADGLLGFQGTTTMGNAAATLTVNSTASIGFYGTGANVLAKNMTLNSGRVSNASGVNSFNGPVTLTGSNRFDIASGTRLTVTGNMSGAGDLHKIGSGTLVIAGNSTISGLTAVSAGTLQFGDGGIAGASGSGIISNTATLIFHRNIAFAVANTITGSGTLQVGVLDGLNTNVGSTAVFNNPNTYTGNTIVYGNGNLLSAGADKAFGTGTLIFNGNNNGNSLTGIRSATANPRNFNNNVQLGGGNRFQFGSAGSGDIVFSGARVITDNADKVLMISNAVTTIHSDIGGNSRLIKTGPGTLVLTGNNTNGAMIIEMGAVRINAENRLGRNPAVFNAAQLAFNGGILECATTFAIDDSNRGISLLAGGGTIEVNPGSTVMVARPITGPGALRKTGAGTLQLAAVNTWTGGTTNLEGALILNGEIRGGPLEIASGTFSGTGKVFGPVVIHPAGSLLLGPSLTTLTAAGTLHLGGTTRATINAALGASAQVRGMTTVTYGGALVVSNVQGQFAGGESFKLFDAASYQGTFQSYDLPPLAPGLFWDTTSLAIDGTLRVVKPNPSFASLTLVDGGLILSGSGGQPGAEFVLRSSTNAALPLNLWPIVSTNLFDLSGAFNLTNAVDPLIPCILYLIQTDGW
jgi:autotransporter-associated beta strand protein